jgi:hypothetical protein
MSDKLVFDLAQEVEGSPNVFVRKDWLNILDNQNQNYNNNQSIIDTSQLSNSNKYMSYREAYLSVPFTITLGKTNATQGGLAFTPGVAANSCDYVLGLKNWYGQIIHSFTLDYNGTTIVQQTPYINMWNSFKLMTSLSLDDINTQGATIGFYPDDATSWQFFAPVASPLLANGIGLCNNTNSFSAPTLVGAFSNFFSGDGNEGFFKRQQLINFDNDGIPGLGSTYGGLLAGASGNATTQVWKSYIFNKTATAPPTNEVNKGVIQYAVVATVYLKHIHSFFNMCPLLKGVFMKMTMNLNNTSSEFSAVGTVAASPGAFTGTSVTCSSVSNPLGGVNPLMIASTNPNNGANSCLTTLTQGLTAGAATVTYRMNISVGGSCLDQQLVTSGAVPAQLSKSIYLYIPAYTFNPVFEQAYLSSPVKQIKYTDVYQYQILSVGSNQVFNNLLTNGIANVKSVLILPFYNSGSGSTIDQPVNGTASYSTNSGFIKGTPVWQSPYDPAGTGTTSPMCWLSNFNIQVSGQNAIYNTERYNFEQFNNQLYGQNAVNGGLTDGLTSGLIDRQKFDMCYSYYYVNIERMLPVEMSVPKSIQVLGQNLSSKVIDLYCFIEYGVEVSIDALTGARV